MGNEIKSKGLKLLDTYESITNEIRQFLTERFTKIDTKSLDMVDVVIYKTLTEEERKRVVDDAITDMAGILFPNLTLWKPFKDVYNWALDGKLIENLTANMNHLKTIFNDRVSFQLTAICDNNEIEIEYEIDESVYLTLRAFTKGEMYFCFFRNDYNNDKHESIDGTLKPFNVFDQDRFRHLPPSKTDVVELSKLVEELISKDSMLKHIENEDNQARKEDLEKLFKLLYG